MCLILSLSLSHREKIWSFLLCILHFSCVCGVRERSSAALYCLRILQATHSDVTTLVLWLKQTVLLHHIYTQPIHSQGCSLQMPHLI